MRKNLGFMAGLALLLFVSCSMTGDPLVSGDGKTLKLTGTLANWSRGARVLETRLSTSSTFSTATGTLSANGEIALSFPEPVDSTLLSISGPSSCGTRYSINPVNARGNSFTQLRVLTPSNILSGTLVRSTVNPRGVLAVGDKFVIHTYVDRDVVITADCPSTSTNSGLKINLTLKQGWNLMLVEQLVDNTLRYSSDGIQSGVDWRFIASTNLAITISNAPTALMIGQSFSLIGAVTEVDGTPSTGASQKLTWVSSNPAVLDVDATGKLTAKRIGSVTITVTATDLATPVVTTFNLNSYGLEVDGGTLNVDNAALGLAMRIQYMNASGRIPNRPYNVTLTGPAGWNGGQPLLVSLSEVGFGSPIQTFTTEIAAVAGIYKIRLETDPVVSLAATVQLQSDAAMIAFPNQPFVHPRTPTHAPVRLQDQGLVDATFSVNPTRKFGTLNNLRLTTVSTTRLEATWDPRPILAPWTLQYDTELIDVTDQKVISSKTRLDTYASSVVFSELTLNASHAYQIRMYTSVLASVFEAPFDASLTSVSGDFRPLVTQLESVGGAATGGYAIPLYGLNFDADTRVFFGSIEATTKSLQSPSRMQIVVPAGSAGTVDITLKDKNGFSSVATKKPFKYFSVSEYAVNSPSRLLSIGNGAIAFIEYNGNASPQTSLTRISSSGVTTRLGLPSVPPPIFGYSSVQDLALDSSGRIWIAVVDQVIRVNANNTLTEIALPSGVQVAMIAFGSDDNLWIARSDSYKITRIKPDGTQAADFSFIAQSNSSFNSNYQLVLGPDNNLWFTSPSGLGRITVTGSITMFSQYYVSSLVSLDGYLWTSSSSALIRVATDGTTASYFQIGFGKLTAGVSGTLWSVGGPNLSSSTKIELVTIGAGNFGVTGSVILDSNSNFSSLSDIATDSTGKIWYINSNSSKVGVLTP